MAASSGKKTSASGRKSSRMGRSQVRKKTERSKQAQQAMKDSVLFHEIGLIILFIVMVILFCCNFGLIGPAGNTVSGILFGVFGFSAYIAPVLVFVAIAFWFANEGNPTAFRKLIAGTVLFVMLGIVFDLIAGTAAGIGDYNIGRLYQTCSEKKNGGGVLAGSICYFLLHYLETVGTVLVVLLCSVISLILLTEKSLISGMRAGGSRIRERTREDVEYRREYAQQRRERAMERRTEQEEMRQRREQERMRKEEERRLLEEEKENERILRMEKKVSGVMTDTTLRRPAEEKPLEDMHEITYTGYDEEAAAEENTAEWQETETAMEELPREMQFGEAVPQKIMSQAIRLPEVPAQVMQTEKMAVSGMSAVGMTAAQAMTEKAISGKVQQENEGTKAGREEALLTHRAEQIRIHKEEIRQELAEQQESETIPGAEKKPEEKRAAAEYAFPPLSCLKKGAVATKDSTRELRETAMRLQQTLHTFGVRVTITDISQGPSVTRYELQPEQGVKVSKIVGLADDIKLNLAATDIRIEAPIPGKAAIGIEVPNKENMTVALRDLFESREFKEFPSKLAFAVGKDIAGKVVVTDIAKMPHMLIAGATGSGKSVCINTLIMSILYKAHPDEVKLIMVDPKVVELSVYNGIPHLLIPVVTDPKKASAALHWGVSEMEDRYRKFAEFNVRDLKGYNKKIQDMRASGDEAVPAALPQIVIIVDELADLMMVCPGEVEESICRLAQLARAAGIHLIIATQRPSVDVITGLIKANMPSRVAFSVSSGVDSRTILDMNGAEKLLGKGDMLFYPQGYSKPARIQGAFVSDREVSDVVDFLKNQKLGNTYAEEIEEKIVSLGAASGGMGASGASARDEYFEEAGKFIIEKDKASIGMLQRVLKIGFNRAARIMDQLCEYDVVGEEEGTKPRKILMSMEQFEQLLEEI